MTEYVKRIVAAFEHCQTFKPTQPNEPLLTTPLPSRPWKKLVIDIYLSTEVRTNCHSRLLLPVEYHNSSVRGQDEGRLRPAFTHIGHWGRC